MGSSLWYDAVTLSLGRYSGWFSFDFQWCVPVVGPSFIDWTFRKNARRLKYNAKAATNNIHVIVGETGVPYSGSEEDYTLSLDRTLRAVESSDLDYAIWCYETGSNAVDRDLWNREDLSLWSEGGGRGLQAAVRPWAQQ